MTPTPDGDPDDRALFWDLAAELFCVLAPDGRILRVNPAWTRTLGWGEQELVGRTAFEFVHPDDLGATRHVSETENAEGQRLEEFQNRYRHKDGSYRWLSWTGYRRGDRWFGTARNITAMRMSHDALQRSERRSRAILGALREGLVVIEPTGKISEVNEAFAEMVGLPVHEITGQRPPYPWWPPEERGFIASELQRTLTSEEATHELTFMRAGGERFPVFISTSSLQERDVVPAALSVVRDISDIVATRNRLAEAQRVVGLVTWEYFADTDEVVSYGSPRSTDPHASIRMSQDEGLAYIPEPWKSTLRRLRGEIVRGERDAFVLEIRASGPGDPNWIEVRGEPMRGPGGHIIGVRGTSQRIDARKHAEFEALLQSRILDVIDVAVIARGPDQRLVFANEAAVRLLGWPRDDLEGTTPDDVQLIAPGQPATDDLIAALKAGTPWDGELTLRRRDGTEVRARVRTAAVRDETGASQYAAGIVIPLGAPD